MASNCLDEFVVNFDLNQLTAEDNVQIQNLKYEKLRKNISWLKSRVISTDFAIQKFQSKKEDLQQSVKAHSITREELKKVCINYKEASEKCVTLENENKALVANQEVLNARVIDIENKYDALLSHANQLQMLIKQLENEKDALTVEKELNKSCTKEDIMVFQQEKDAMINDFIALKDVILGKKKTSKKYINILKKYVKGVKYKEPKILCTSEESGDDMDKYCDVSSNAKKLNEVHNKPDKHFMTSVEQNFMDNCSDGQVSVDTGRGSSRATSHDKYLSSPDYVATLDALLKSPRDIVQVDAASSPITIYPSRSIATSPVLFEDCTTLTENHYNDDTECVDDTEYTNDDVPITDEIDELVEQEQLADCPSPLPDISNFDTEIRPLGSYKYIIIKEDDIGPSHKSIFDPTDQNEASNIEQEPIINEFSNCICNNCDKRILIDACTSPIQTSHKIQKLVDIATSTIENDENINILKNTITIGTNTCNELDCENAINNIKSTEKILVDASTNINSIPLENNEDRRRNNIVDIEISVPTKQQCDRSKISLITSVEKTHARDEQTSVGLDINSLSKSSSKTANVTEKTRTKEKVCLESNSSKKLHFERSNDDEVQNILNVMKFRQDLVSPMAKSPSEYEYLKLIPEMNSTLAKILSTIRNMHKMPDDMRNDYRNSQNSDEINTFEEFSETQIYNTLRTCNQERLKPVETQVTEDNVKHKNNTDVDNKCSKQPMPDSKKTNLRKTRINDLFDDTLLPHHMLAGKKLNSIHEQVSNSTFNSVESIGNPEKIEKVQHILASDVSSNDKDSDEPNYSEINNTETSSTSETHMPHTIIINGTKSKKKSKLDKFREKLMPACKIKKVTPPIMKHALKTHVKPKKTDTSPSINHKLAYEKAVKVMAELRSHQELLQKKKQDKSVTKDISCESTTNQNKSDELVEQNVLCTRSRTRRFSKKEEDTTITEDAEKNIKDIEKSPTKRKLRKRSANMREDNSRSKFRRILRSSNVTHVYTENVSSEDENGNESDYKETSKIMSNLDNLSSKDSKPMNEVGDKLNVENNHEGPQKESAAAVDCNIFGTSVRSTKPVIDLSNCLTDNANVVSIIPGNVDYLDVNKNISLKNNLVEFNSHLLGNHNDQQDLENVDSIMENNMESPNTDQCVTQITKVMKKSKDIKVSAGLVENTSSSSNNGNLNSNAPTDNRNEDKSMQKDITNISNPLEDKLQEDASTGVKKQVIQIITTENDMNPCEKNIVSYGDLDMYTEGSIDQEKGITTTPPANNLRRKDNILCTALDRYGVISVKYVAKKVPDNITLKICQKIEGGIAKIIASPKSEQKSKMEELVHSIKNFKTKQVLSGFMKYLKDPTRKNELFNKIINGPAPPMTKPEVILLYVVQCLNEITADFINRLWNNIEHALFQLNRAPEFEVIESMSHFYAVLCRYFRNKSRLRCFMLDAMYCLQFKAIPLIRQCLDVCPGVLPNAHEHMAKTSLVTCLVYLLHFYKCQDKFNRAQDIRNILNRKYQYRFSEWNETMILEIFRKAIMDLRGTHNDKKMLRVALVILCKRHGAKWCQLNIIQNMLLPIIEKKDVPDKTKQFCILMLGPLLKPFPADRKAQCEIVINQLLQMLKQEPSHEMKEAIYSSLIFMNKHDQDRVVQALLSWSPEKVSAEFEDILNDYVMEKPQAMWKKIVAKKPSQCT